MNDNIFLDIDESIKMKNLLLPDKDKDALNQQMDELMKQFDSKASILVQPTPGICVKTKTTDKRKIFVNICISDKIPPPDDISDTKLFELLNDEVPNYIIPMSICGEKMETDKSGIPSATYDVMINEAYFKKCQEKKHFMAFTILVILSGVADKFDKKLDAEDYIILKNRKVSIENIVVLINSDRMNITDKKACSYDILFPYILEANSAKAFLDCSIMVLRIDSLIKQK